MTEQRERGAAGRGTGPGRLWRKLAGRIPRLSRPWRLARNLACIVALVYLMWLLAGANAVTPSGPSAGRSGWRWWARRSCWGSWR